MKHLKQRCSRVLFLMIALFALCTSALADNFTEGAKLYLQLNDNWPNASAVFKANFKNSNSNSLVSFSKSENESNLYECTVPSGTWNAVDLQRIDPNNSSSVWNNVTNIPAQNGKNKIVLTDGTWNSDGGGYNWEIHTTENSGDQQEYTIWFYDINNNGEFRDIHTHIWDKETYLHKWRTDDEKMTRTDKYVLVDDKYYPAYSYTFSWDKTPKNIMFSWGNGDNDKTAEYAFSDKAWYTNSGEYKTGLTLVDKPIKVYIGGSFTGWFSPAEITSQDGVFAPYVITVDGGAEFRFYTVANPSSSQDATWLGANEYTTLTADGTSVYTATSNKVNTYAFKEAGTYTINVSSYSNGNVTFTVSKKQEQGGSKILYLAGDLNDFEGMVNGWENKTNYVYPGQVIKINASQNNRNFQFKNNDNKQFGPEGGSVTIAGEESYSALYDRTNVFTVPALYGFELTIISVSETEGVKFSVKETEHIKPVPKDYYFVGDLNDWFSTEFSETKYVVDEGGNYVQLPYKNEETGVEGIRYEICQKDKAPAEWDGKYYKIENQGDFKLFEDNKENWKFEFVGEIPGYDGDNWYMFDKFPYGALTGQFQISDGNKWDGDVYCHAQDIVQDKDNIYPNPDHEQYKKYCSTSITHDQIRYGEVLVKGEYEKGLLTNAASNGMIQRGNGQNFHMECNAVNNAVIYFQPGDDPKMIIQGDPVDFYIFYGMKEDKETSNNNVRARINQGKPNTNNYFLPGVWYGQYNDNNVNNGRLVLPNVPENQEHMNIEGQDLVKINLEDATVDNLKNVTDKYGNNLFYDCKTTDELLMAIVKNKVLPNNMSLEGYSEIWVQKIPNGFCNPAGRKFTLSFQESLNEADRKPVYTVTSNHMYFFSMENAHVHVDAKSIEEVANVKVSYRIYGQDAYWNTVVLKPEHLSTDVIRIYNRRETPKATASEPDEDPKKDAGWIEINSEYAGCDSWNCTHLYHGTQSSEWKYSDRTFGQEDAVNVLADEAENSDPRLGVASRYSHKYVQFKLEYSPKPESGVQFKPYTVYVPSAPRAIAENQKYNLNGHDYYMNLSIDDPIVTGIEGVFDDMTVGSNQEVDATPVYYNLQGVRVEKPTKGIYIKVTGSKSEKVLF